MLLWRLLFAAPEDEATVQEMKRLCDKVTEMQNQRQMLEQQFRDEILKDDLTAALVTQADKNQEVCLFCIAVSLLLYLQIIFFSSLIN